SAPRDTLGLHDLDHALHAERPADGGRRAPAELLHKAVVTTARAHGTLRAEAVREPFEHRARVVVEPAHEPRVHGELDADVREQRLHLLEMRARLVVQVT